MTASPAIVRPRPFERDFGPFVEVEAASGDAALLAVERFRPQPGGVSVANPVLRICRHLDAPLRFSHRARGGRFTPEFIGPGQHFLFTAESEAQFAWSEPFRTFSLSIAPTLLREFEPGTAGGGVRVSAEDPVLERLTGLAWLDAQEGFVRGPLFAEGVALAVAAHLAACDREGRGAAPPAARGTLSVAQLRAVREAVEAALPGRVQLQALAEAADHPAHRLGGAFRRTTGRSLWDYASERRIALAETLLRNPELSLAAVAVRAGYSSQAHMTTAFRRTRGVTPSAWRNLHRG
jgi:AraC-like DNA-binding protein